MSFSLMQVFLDAALEPAVSADGCDQVVFGRVGNNLQTEEEEINSNSLFKLLEFFQDSSCRSGQLPPVTRPEHTMHSNENWVRTEIITRFYTCEKTRWAPCEKNVRQLPNVTRKTVGFTSFNYGSRSTVQVTTLQDGKGGLVINPVLINCQLILTQCENSC